MGMKTTKSMGFPKPKHINLISNPYHEGGKKKKKNSTHAK
jgi:hypothetical protein